MGLLNGFINRPDEWSYKIPFAVQWVWPIPIIIGSYCTVIPELFITLLGCVRKLLTLCYRSGS